MIKVKIGNKTYTVTNESVNVYTITGEGTATCGSYPLKVFKKQNKLVAKKLKL